MTILIREQDASKFDSLNKEQGLKLSKELPKGDLALFWAEDEQWWEEV